MLLFYIYIHYYIENKSKIVIYVGKGSKNRAYNFSNRNDVYRKYRDKYGNPEVEIVKHFNSENEAYKCENKLRKKYYEKGQAICSLDINRVGDNNYWRKNGIHPEVKEKIRNTLTGRKASEETKKRMSEVRKGKNNQNYGNGHKISGNKHPKSRKCAIINKEGKIEKVFTNVIFMMEYMEEKYDFTRTKYYLLKNEEVKSRYKRHEKIKGYTFIYID